MFIYFFFCTCEVSGLNLDVGALNHVVPYSPQVLDSF